ncbi:hypothetical protein [Halorubrum sp. AJ67]|uniref:hypothetical protein n=1 Tax=Halorubrum sp. AJ67 TaxID=1173487 RepID=UPI0003DBE34B|nr:hypothetical protein [Halorubrum sp. AJ67]CDK39143.1 putative membrane protein [Halorubrum sp. AJ67]
MKIVCILKRWKEEISLLFLCVGWILLGVINGGLSIPNTPYEVSLLVMFLLTFGILVHKVRQSASA